VKPANVVYDRASGAVSLIDFGAVRDSQMNGSTMIGTFGYMPPEQARARSRCMSAANLRCRH
jgi:serine/threonine protein kinase